MASSLAGSRRPSDLRLGCLALSLVFGGSAPVEAQPSRHERQQSLERLADIVALQCVPYARETAGIRIYGDAWTWWDQAAGRYPRGSAPQVGAVLAFKPFGKMRLGHVAAVSRIVSARVILLRHANWSLIDGRRGQIEEDVEAKDVSPNNDWSQVRVWFAPLGNLGGTQWPVFGFIYPKGATPVRPIADNWPAQRAESLKRRSKGLGDIIAALAPSARSENRAVVRSAGIGGAMALLKAANPTGK